MLITNPNTILVRFAESKGQDPPTDYRRFIQMIAATSVYSGPTISKPPNHFAPRNSQTWILGRYAIRSSRTVQSLRTSTSATWTRKRSSESVEAPTIPPGSPLALYAPASKPRPILILNKIKCPATTTPHHFLL